MLRGQDILRRRASVRSFLRLISVLLPVAGAVFVAVVFVFRFPNLVGFFSDLNWYVYPLVAAVLGIGAPALLLALFADRLAAWIVPAATPACPECGYSLRGAAKGTNHCPECGSDLAGAALDRP